MIKFYPHKPGNFDDHGEPVELEYIADIQLHVDISPFVLLYKIPHAAVYRPFEYKIVALINDELVIIGYVEDGRNIEIPILENNNE